MPQPSSDTPPEESVDREDLPPGVSGPPGFLLKVIKDQRIAFLFVGGVNTVVGTVWYAVFYTLLAPLLGDQAHFIVLVPTYIAAILCAFVLYRTLVFRVKGHFFRDLLRFASVYVGTFLLNFPLMWLMADVLGLPAIWAQVVNVAVSTVVSYVFHKRFSFHRSETELNEQKK